MNGKILTLLILFICVLGCKYLVPQKSTQNTKKEMDWRDLPSKQAAKIEVPPYNGSLADLLPEQIGEYKRTESRSTVKGFHNPDETWVAYYFTDDGKKLHFYMQKFRDADKAYGALVSEVTATVGSKVTKNETAVKNGKNVGTKVCKAAHGKPDTDCPTMMWTNGSIAVTLYSSNKNLDGASENLEDIYTRLSF